MKLLPGSAGLLYAEIAIIAALLLALQILALRESYRRRLGQWLASLNVQLVALYAGYVTVFSVFHLPQSPALTVIGMGVYLAYPIMFGIFLLLCTASDVERLAEWLIFFALPIVSIGAILSILTQNPLVASQEIAYLGTEDQTVFDALRATSFTGSSLHLGIYCAITLPMALGHLILKRSVGGAVRVWSWAALLLGLLALVLSFSRGAWMQALVSLAAVAVLTRAKLVRNVWVWIGAAAVGFASTIFGRDYFGLWLLRLRSVLDWTSGKGNLDRISIWKTSVQKLADSYFLGYGPSSTGNAPARFGITPVATVTESSYLKLLLELGVIGTALFVIIYYRFAAACLSLIRRTREEPYHWLAVSIFASLIGLAVEMAIYQSIETQIAQGLLWYQFAAIALIYRREKGAESIKRESETL